MTNEDLELAKEVSTTDVLYYLDEIYNYKNGTKHIIDAKTLKNWCKKEGIEVIDPTASKANTKYHRKDILELMHIKDKELKKIVFKKIRQQKLKEEADMLYRNEEMSSFDRLGSETEFRVREEALKIINTTMLHNCFKKLFPETYFDLIELSEKIYDADNNTHLSDEDKEKALHYIDTEQYMKKRRKSTVDFRLIRE